MGRLIVVTGLVGWAGIVALWHHLAAQSDAYCIADVTSHCMPNEASHAIIIGLVVALLYVLAAMCVAVVIKSRRDRPSSWTPANQEQPTRLRQVQ